MANTNMKRSPPTILRSILFVPATRPDRIIKALASAADMICIDLEDAVAPQEKSTARANICDFLASSDFDPCRSMIRINASCTEYGRSDLQALAKLGQTVPLIMVPKVEGVAEIDGVRDEFDGEKPDIIALIESPKGLFAVEDIAECADRGVVALVFGSADYGAQVGCDDSWDALVYARGRIAAAAALGAIPAIDGVWFDIQDGSGLTAETERIKTLGFSGKLAIHPSQVDLINAAYEPSPEAIDRARRIVDASSKSQAGVTVVDGRMVDAPIVESARQVLSLATHYDVAMVSNDKT